MLTVIIIILGISFFLYTVLGGADFGAGIIETFAGKKEEHTIARAMAPVWEANHVWLILSVVILFTAFPLVYSSLSTVLHIPLMLVLLGIIIRGSAFTFRHYDTGGRVSHKYFSFLFKLSSFVTPFFLGIVLGSMILGRIRFDGKGGFYEIFISPWLNSYCIVMGIFTSCLFAYLAAVFLVGETRVEKERKIYAGIAGRTMVFTLFTGLAVFVIAEIHGFHLAKAFFTSGTSVVMLSIAVILCPLIWFLLKREKNKTVYLRIGAAIQIALILIGWFYIQFPVIIQVKGGASLTFFNTAAPDATLKQLLIALIAGMILIVPGFIYLLKVFKIGDAVSPL